MASAALYFDWLKKRARRSWSLYAWMYGGKRKNRIHTSVTMPTTIARQDEQEVEVEERTDEDESRK